MGNRSEGGQPVIVIAGGGITGLSAAYYVMKSCRTAGVEADIRLYESGPGLGGKIETLHRDGFVIERGPDSFLSRKLPVIHLTRELGLEEELTGTNPQAKKTYILHRGKLRRMPPGLVLGIPTQLKPFLQSDLLSLGGKSRALLDLLLPRGKELGDESLGHFLTRRLGKEVLANIAEPLLAGIYAGDTHNLSLQATFPQFRQAERTHGSLIRGMTAGRKPAVQEPNGLQGGIGNSVFLTYRQGLTTLVDALTDALRAGGVTLVTSIALERVELAAGRQRAATDGGSARGAMPSCTIRLSDGTVLTPDALIMTLPTYATARLLAGIPEVKRLGDINYVSVANVVSAFRKQDVPLPLDGSGFLVPRKEKRRITACTWTSSKWLHTSPADKALLRCYVGRSGEEDWQQLSDEEIVRRVRADLRDTMGIAAEPMFTEIKRLPRSMPQYPVGHLENVARAREAASAVFPGLYLTGAGFHGVGIPDCIRQGKEAAEHVFSQVMR